jgi:hypothetical protein
VDSGINETAVLIDQPTSSKFHIKNIVKGLLKFNGNFIMQTMFLRGNLNGIQIDNTTEIEVDGWLEIVKETNPKQIMIYSIDRDTPIESLEKVSKEDLTSIAKRAEELGFNVLVAG